jgi:putative peptide zinc metalloprotease protein
VRADGVQLLGEMQGSGYREPPALVRRADGQVLQLTPLLYRVLETVDGTRDASEIAAAVAAAEGRSIGAGDVEALITAHLRPLGLLRRPDGSEPDVKRSDPLLRMRFRIAVTDPERTRRLTRPFRALFSPFVVVPVLIAFAVVCWWLLMAKGLASATHDAFESPGLLLLVFVVTLLSAGFHEFGHAAAAARAGAAPGAMGAGLYLVWPAFYTDVTDSYRLGRRGRLLTDLGGLYFNAIVAVAIVAVWWATRYDALLLIVATQLIMMVRQLIPIVRFDGYHVLADATGVPDLFHRIRPTLLGLLPWRWKDPETRVLKPGARAVITLWVLTVVPLLLVTLAALVLSFPRLAGTAWHGVQDQARSVAEGVNSGDFGAAAGHVLGILAIAIPMAGLCYILVRLTRQLVRGAWRGTKGRPVRRVIALGALLAVFAAVALAWWPEPGKYRPVEAYEGGTLVSAVERFVPPSAGLRQGQQGSTVAVLPASVELPDQQAPLLAVVLVPRDDATAPSWVFPFDRPEAPSGQDTQALAVNTEDGSVVYDVAFALVWADGDQAVDTTNEAYAFARCADCGAVAVSFQVVLIAGQADVVVPQNISAAVNYECFECVTFALASQLVLTVDGPLSAETMTELERLWAEIAAYGQSIPDRPLAEIAAALERYKLQIVELLRGAPSEESPGAVEPSPTTEPSSVPDTGGSPAPGSQTTPAPDSETGQSPPSQTSAPAPSPVATTPPSPEPAPTGAGE